MKKLFFKSLLFVSLIAILAAGSYTVNNCLISAHGYNLKDSTEVIITGSSLVTLGLNPDFIPRSENIGLAAEPVVISFFKLRDILRGNHFSLKKVVISCSIQEMTNQDIIFSDNKPMIVEMFTRLSFLNQPITLKDLKAFNVDYMSYFEVFIRHRLFPNYAFFSRWINKDIKSNDIESLLHIGGFQKGSAFNKRETGERKINLSKFVTRYFPKIGFENKISPINYQYLDSIKLLCKSHNIELVAIGMPVSKELYEIIPTRYKEYYKDKMCNFGQQSNCSYIDLTCSGQPKWFSDHIHLNEIGAENISKIVNNQLNIDL